MLRISTALALTAALSRDPRIDSITPPKRAALSARCATGRFVIRRRQLSVRLGRGPLRATLSGGDAVDIRIKTFGIE